MSGSETATSDRRAQRLKQTDKFQKGARAKSVSNIRIALSGRVIEPDTVAIVIGNHESSEVRLDDKLEIERYSDKGWKPFGARDVKLRYSCESKVDECIALLPGAELHPPPWQAASGPSQCRSRVSKSAPSGRYRFIVRGCDRAFVVFGEPFRL